FVVGLGTPGVVWDVYVGSGTFTFMVAAMHAAMRAARGLRPLMGLSIGLAVGVAAFGAIGGALGLDLNDGGQFAVTGTLAVLIAYHASSPPLRGSANARLIAVGFAVVAAYQFLRLGFHIAVGREQRLTIPFVDDTSANLILDSFLVVITITLCLFQAERVTGRPELVADAGSGVVSSVAFRNVGESWLRLANRRGRSFTLLVVEIVNLEEIGVAFGREQREAAFRAVNGVVLAALPLGSLVGRTSASRTAALLVLPPELDPATLAARIERDVLRAVVDEADRFRAAVQVAVEEAMPGDERLDDLLARAEAQLTSVPTRRAPAHPESR
ncbi:MAG: GGDEF domain-containing protein, partial [Leucobacter sp.]|nr:GGDEF domain-containing protein [Leucobacter sp.]